MESFEEWAKNLSEHPSIHRWADRLVELGASWDSFRRPDTAAIVRDLIDGGIPVLAARDIVNVATAAVRRREAPMAIFWDLENIPLPVNSSGRDVVRRLKASLLPHGDLVQFRGYASIGLGQIPQHKRSDLPLSGCHLVDCPHSGRKEVADKMIIVDAMQFAFQNPEAATLCFVTGDVDYAYLLAVLQRPQWRTIVISKGTLQSMLHVNCDMKMRWETDILQYRITSNDVRATVSISAHEDVEELTAPGRNPGGTLDSNSKGTLLNFKTPSAGKVQQSTDGENEVALSGARCIPSGGNSLATTDNDSTAAATPGGAAELEPLTEEEEWADTVEFLRTILRENGTKSDGLHFSMRKSQVGIRLRTQNPVRFQDRETVRSFFAQAIESGDVIETGNGAFKVLSLPPPKTDEIPSNESSNSHKSRSQMSVSDNLTIDIGAIPLKVAELATRLPFIIIIPNKDCEPGAWYPKWSYVYYHRKWLILLHHTLLNAKRTATECPWLLAGQLVDWRRISRLSKIGINCKKEFQVFELEQDGDQDIPLHCASCHAMTWSEDDRNSKAQRVLDLVKRMAENDEIAIAEFELQAYLLKQSRSEFGDRDVSLKTCGIWIEEALRQNLVTRFSRYEFKKPRICLPDDIEMAKSAIPSDSTDTSKEQEFVIELLERNGGWMARNQVAASLHEKFGESMDSPYKRTQVLMHGYRSKKIFMAKSYLGCTIATSRILAQKAIALCYGGSMEGNSTSDSIQGETSMDFSECDEVSRDETSFQSW